MSETSTGIIRKVDDAGRISPPVELTKMRGMQADDLLQFEYDNTNHTIWFCKYEDECGCINCGSQDNLETFLDKKICVECWRKMMENNNEA